MQNALSFGRLERRWWAVVLAVVFIGVTTTSYAWHVDHSTDQDCAVCQLRNEPADALSELPSVAAADTPGMTLHTEAVRWAASDHGSGIPARAPPQ